MNKDELQHYGVLGMKWGVRKAKYGYSNSEYAKAAFNLRNVSTEQLMKMKARAGKEQQLKDAINTSKKLDTGMIASISKWHRTKQLNRAYRDRRFATDEEIDELTNRVKAVNDIGRLRYGIKSNNNNDQAKAGKSLASKALSAAKKYYDDNSKAKKAEAKKKSDEEFNKKVKEEVKKQMKADAGAKAKQDKAVNEEVKSAINSLLKDQATAKTESIFSLKNQPNAKDKKKNTNVYSSFKI